MELRAITLKNFRGFTDAKLPLRPLTLLVGPNSSGKSAFGQALAALAHSHFRHKGAGYFETSLTPRNSEQARDWPVDLGQLKDLLTVGAELPVAVGLETLQGTVEWGFGLAGESDLLLSRLQVPAEDVSAGVVRNQELTAPASKAATSAGTSLGSLSRAQIRDHSLQFDRLNRQQWCDGRRNEVRVDMDGLVLRAAAHGTGSPLAFGSGALKTSASLLENLCYLRGVRQRPLRAYDIGRAERQPMGYGGEWTASELEERGEDQTTYLVPSAIPDYRGAVDKYLDREWPASTLPLHDAIAFWTARLGLSKSITAERRSGLSHQVSLTATLSNQLPRDITEVGLGISQVLPVIMAGLRQPPDSLFVVDLPESHLHPRPQAELADFFCSLALSKRYCLIETHSEMMFHRIRLRCAMDDRLKDQVAVYFMDQPSNGCCSEPRRVGLETLDQVHWPVGFLEEGLEIEMQLAAIREARKSRR